MRLPASSGPLPSTPAGTARALHARVRQQGVPCTSPAPHQAQVCASRLPGPRPRAAAAAHVAAAAALPAQRRLSTHGQAHVAWRRRRAAGALGALVPVRGDGGALVLQPLQARRW